MQRQDDAYGAALRAHRAGDFAAAEALWHAVLTANPERIDARRRLGEALAAQGRFDDAAAAFEEAVRQKPYLAEIHVNLAILYDRLDREAEALASFAAALALNPRLADAHYNRANLHRRRGRPGDAEADYREAIRLRPDHVAALNNLATLLRDANRLDEAETLLVAAVEVDPDRPESHYNLALVHEANGATASAADSYAAACALRPTAGLLVKLATLLPPIPDSVEEIAAVRRRYAEGVLRLRDQPPAIADPLGECDWTSFYLAYHGENDRDLQLATSAMFTAACPALAADLRPRRRRPGRIRLGFVSRYFKDHTIGALFAGVIAAIDRDRFELTVFQVGAADDPVAEEIRASAEHHVVLPVDLFPARAAIAAAEPDAILYTDIGMDPATYFLAHARLAPVQMATWGHPLTSGIANVDYFLSAAEFDADDAQDAYSENLVRLAGLLLCYDFPGLDLAARRREDLGLDRDLTAYLCVQSLFKHHPAYDRLYADILRGDPRGHLYLLSGHRRRWNDRLLARLKRVLPEAEERVTFLPHFSRDDFIRVMAAADVVLDTPVFSGGKTSLECIAVGTPAVTLPSPYLRGRLTYGMYRRIGVPDCIARDGDHYVEIALGLGRDRARRETLRDRLLGANRALFGTVAVVREFEDFVAGAVSRAAPR